MSARARRGGTVRPAPGKGRATPAQSARRSGSIPARARRGLPIEVDRIVLMRVAFIIVVLAFLYLVVWIGTRAFGTGTGQITRIDRVVIDATAPSASPAAAPGTDAVTPRRTAP